MTPKTKVRILNVEDDVHDSKLIEARLEAGGFESEITRVDTAEHYREALERGGFDVIICDFSLPSYDGQRALQLAKQCRPEIPFIFFSGVLGEDLAVESLREGASDYVLKQRPARLVPAVQRALEDAHELAERKLAQEALRESESRLNFALHAVQIGYWDMDLSTLQSQRTPQHDHIFGYDTPLSEWTHSLFLQHVVCDDREMVDGEFKVAVESLADWDFECRIIRNDGVVRWILMVGRHCPAGSGRPSRMAGIIQDITDRKSAEESLQRYRLLSENTNDVMLFMSVDGSISDVNTATIRTYGYDEEELKKMNVSHLWSANAGLPPTATTEQSHTENMRFDTEHQRKDGSVFPVEVTIQTMAIGEEKVLMCVVRDTTERKALENELRHQAFHDPLTGLPNRILFQERVGHALIRDSRYNRGIALLFLDLDHFKAINDSLGHQAGDQVLMEVAGRVRACLRASDTAARLSGDEFTVLLEEMPTEGDAILLAQRILERLAQPFYIDGNEIAVDASIGIVMGLGTRDSVDDLMRQADVAMYQAKAGGRGSYIVFRHQMSLQIEEQIEMETELGHALERGEFRVFYQPIIRMDTGHVMGVEALVRWEHPRHGLLPPNAFIPIQERIGLIDPFTLWVLREAQMQCLAWHAAGYYLTISVNLSPHNLRGPNFVECVSAVLAQTGLSPSWLRLEITESAVMTNAVQAIEALERFNAMGINLSMDDFGTGYSSLSYLKQLPVHEVKIDKSFVMAMDASDEQDAVIVRATIDLAHNLRKRVVAEGVENDTVWNMLNGLGCDAAQGFHMGRPMPAEALTQWLETSAWAPNRIDLSPHRQIGLAPV